MSRVAVAILIAAAALRSAGAAEYERSEPVDVRAIRPLPGVGLPAEHLPYNVQTIDVNALRRSHSTTLPEAMMRHLPSVNVNEVQGNPLQLDVNYRGFTASPLLGTPQGLSVFQDGVRLNEPFGDVVNWDLIPMLAIATVSIVPGSNPLFGLNTLGGALVLHTKSGLTSPGTEVVLAAGSSGRRKLDLAHGARSANLHFFGAASGFEEDGWRDHSPSRVRNAFAKIGQVRRDLEWDAAWTYATSDLIGNGLTPEPMLASHRAAIYTRPDLTHNEMLMAVLNGSYWLSAHERISTVVYQRRVRTSTLNGDVNDDFEDPPEPPAVENRTHTRQRATGLGLQWSRASARSNIALGATHDRSRSHFRQSEAEGVFDATHAVIPVEPPEIDVRLRGRSRTTSVYVTQTYALVDDVQLTASARYNVTRVQTIDELNGPAVPNLNGDFTYRKLNPAIGVAWQTAPRLTLYTSFTQGNRAPSPIELGCADPAQPCTLPNALQSDPFLEQVVARTFELGARGVLGNRARWNAGLFHTRSSDDILFVGTAASASRGFFQNFGRTRRQGVELGLSGRVAGVDLKASYSYVDATFRSSACIVSEANSSAGASPRCAAEQIEIRPGDRIPGIPRHNLRLDVTGRPTERFTLGTTLFVQSSQYVRGNENNAHRPDNVTFEGSGKLGGYAILNAFATYDLGGAWQLYAQVTNVFDRNYATAGQLGPSAFDADGAFVPDSDAWRMRQFAGPGTPRAGWIGLRYLTRKRR